MSWRNIRHDLLNGIPLHDYELNAIKRRVRYVNSWDVVEKGTMSHSDFVMFCRALRFVSTYCSNVSIENGIICQMSHVSKPFRGQYFADNQLIIYCDLRDIFPLKHHVVIREFKRYNRIFNSFRKTAEPVVVSVERRDDSEHFVLETVADEGGMRFPFKRIPEKYVTVYSKNVDFGHAHKSLMDNYLYECKIDRYFRTHVRGFTKSITDGSTLMYFKDGKGTLRMATSFDNPNQESLLKLNMDKAHGLDGLILHCRVSHMANYCFKYDYMRIYQDPDNGKYYVGRTINAKGFDAYIASPVQSWYKR